MKGSRHPKNDLTLNPSGNPSIHDVIDSIDGGRRRFIQSSFGAATLASAAPSKRKRPATHCPSPWSCKAPLWVERVRRPSPPACPSPPPACHCSR